MSAIHLRLLGGARLLADENGRERPISMPPKPMALLAFLAVAGADGGSIRRDTLLGLFWPELPDSKARAALRQVLFRVRRILGGEALVTDRESVALAPGVLSCDVVAFERALSAADPASAAELYRGDLLEGFYVDGMSRALEDWIDRERAELQRKALRACWSVADEAERRHDVIGARDWAHRAVLFAPVDEIAVRRLMGILDRLGDLGGALHAFDDLVGRLVEEFDAVPSAETRKLAEAIRARGVGNLAAGRSRSGEPEESSLSPVAGPIRFAGAVPTGSRRPGVATVVVPDGASPGDPPPAGPPPAPPSGTRPCAARRPDTTEKPAPRPRRPRWWPRPGRRWTRTVAAAAVTLVTTAGFLLTSDGRGGPGRAAREGAGSASPRVTIASPVARLLYEEGLGRYYAGDDREAGRLLQAALAEDSSCAMCAYYAWKADAGFDAAASARMLRLAVRLGDRVTEPERMLIRYGWADATNSPARLAVAESIVSRYPAWPQAELAAGQALWMAGDPLAAAPHLRRAISSDSGRDTASAGDCPACTAEYLLVNGYRAIDSLPAAIRSARAWVRERPRSRSAWLELANALAVSGRYDEARAALDSSTSYAAGTQDDPVERAEIEIRAGDFHVADGLLRSLAMTGGANSRLDALWWLVISLRDQGRLREALAVAGGPMRSAEAATALAGGGALVAEGQVLFEMGRFRQAAEAFEKRADLPVAPASPGVLARQHAWYLTHAGSALAGGGDTVTLASLIDTVEAWGRRSGFGRDLRLHEYLRGLLWQARGRPEEAVAAFGRAMVSATEGFSRLDLELANTLLALHRPAEAVALLQSALAGSLEGGNYYVTRTELQEVLARAFEAAGQPDSAVVYYGRVARAWQEADPSFEPRVAHARARIALQHKHLLAGR